MMKKCSILLYVLFCYQIGFAQITIKGSIQDKSTGLSVPYAAIVIAGTTNGTLTNEKGNFEFTVSHSTDYDTIRISAIGYKPLSVPRFEITKIKGGVFLLDPIIYNLSEVKIKPRTHKILGTSDYTKRNCTAFAGLDSNWKGRQAAIKANNKPGVKVFLETFGFYIVKNLYPDSLTFRIMLYEVNEKGYPGPTFLQKPIIFKTDVKQGEVLIDLKPYAISTSGDFFISLECLEEEMESAKFCFAGSIKVPSYFKTSAFGRWGKVKGGGGDFNVKVSYVK